MPLILGIETSCDETSAAVYNTNNLPKHADRDSENKIISSPAQTSQEPQSGILSNVTYSQIDHHKKFGGVMPEVASRSQLEKITPIVKCALKEANVSLEDIDAIAVTKTPGLSGSLLVGVCFAKALAWGASKKIIGVNHLEAHAFSPLLEHNIPFPHLCLTASGGHTSLYLVEGLGNYKLIAETLDDAAGEAFDKVAKMMGLDYPGGPIIERLAREAEFQDYCNYPRGKRDRKDFSFSGLKTAVLYDLVKKNAYDMQKKQFLRLDDHQLKKEVSSSLLVCITDIFAQKIKIALKNYPQAKAVTMAGGVACNKYIKQQLTQLCKRQGIQFFTPSPKYCTDNAAMIALVGAYKYQEGKFDDFDLDIFE